MAMKKIKKAILEYSDRALVNGYSEGFSDGERDGF